MHEEIVNYTHTWVGIAVLAIFVVGYYFIATEEKFEINKSKPALFIGTFSFLLIGTYFWLNHLDPSPLHEELKHLIEEIAEIFFFLMVAMTYIESLIERGVFDALKYRLISRGYTYKKIFWITGTLSFWISPFADNLTTALILSTVLITIDKHNINFLVPGAINIVVAANAGGAWSPFGDITTLMAWTSGKGEIIDFLALFPAVFIGWLLSAWLLSLFVPKGKPHFDALTTPKVEMKNGGKVIIFLGALTIAIAVFGHIVMHFPAMWGMMFGLALLELYSFYHKRKYKEKIDVFVNMAKIEHDTLLFFFGILSAVGALYFLGWLFYVTKLYEIIGPTWGNIGVGFISSIIDNVPVMAAILKADPPMDAAQWMLVTMTAGIGGSLISFGSAAGVGVMGRMRGIYTFNTHIKYAWAVLIGYLLSCAIWYVQFEILHWY
ncbi:sodium:proton antiporter NhaD [Lebetimonas sp. JH292]|uniref:sodium:proton antiporter NhaD n=1 Tax=Lebetimonas sp. JH292 TaxID=990068 RepID=UPI00046379E0|nr:sodium:proton antiporter NhaD [Lebetimonas sp. JH292]